MEFLVHWIEKMLIIFVPQVFHNPGVVPDSRYLTTADSTVVFEATYDTFQERNGSRLFEAIPDSDRSQLCAEIGRAHV